MGQQQGLELDNLSIPFQPKLFCDSVFFPRTQKGIGVKETHVFSDRSCKLSATTDWHNAIPHTGIAD